MATVEEAIAAMKEAVRQGRAEEAKRIAQELRRKQAQAGQVESGEAPGKATTESGITFGEGLVGAGEAALTFASGAFAEPLAGLAALRERNNQLFRQGLGLEDAVTGKEDDLASVVQRIEDVRKRFVFQPRTEAGKKIVSAVAKPFEFLFEKGEQAGEAVLRKTESPMAATAVQTTVEMLPAALGVRVPGRQARADIARIRAEEQRTGVDLGETPMERTRQIRRAAEKETGGVRELGETLPDVAAKIQEARRVARDARKDLYEQARELGGEIDPARLAELPDVMRSSLTDFDVETMPIVQRRLTELEAIIADEKSPSVSLDRLDRWRKRLNKNRPKVTDTSQAAAIDLMKGQLDNYVDDLFDTDMISGSPAAIAKWKEARQAHADYKARFFEDKVIRKMWQQEATPEELRKWVFGATITGAKKEAGATIGRIKQLIGEDSPEFRALRQDALLELMQPLLRETPDFVAFAKNYDALLLRNASLAKQLFPESETALKALRDFAAVSESVTPALKNQRIARMGAVAMFGHGIARAALRVRLAEAAFDILRKIPQESRRRQAMAEILGYDAGKPVFQARAAVIPAVGQTAVQQQEAVQ